jgi:hypothetical protein
MNQMLSETQCKNTHPLFPYNALMINTNTLRVRNNRFGQWENLLTNSIYSVKIFYGNEIYQKFEDNVRMNLIFTAKFMKSVQQF